MKKLVLDVINAARYQARFLERGGSHPDTTNTLQVSPHVLAVVVRALGLTLRMHQPCIVYWAQVVAFCFALPLHMYGVRCAHTLRHSCALTTGCASTSEMWHEARSPRGVESITPTTTTMTTTRSSLEMTTTTTTTTASSEPQPQLLRTCRTYLLQRPQAVRLHRHCRVMLHLRSISAE